MRNWQKNQKKDNLIQESFILGMFTVIDALLDKPIEEILDEFPIENEIKKALDK